MVRLNAIKNHQNVEEAQNEFTKRCNLKIESENWKKHENSSRNIPELDLSSSSMHILPMAKHTTTIKVTTDDHDKNKTTKKSGDKPIPIGPFHPPIKKGDIKITRKTPRKI